VGGPPSARGPTHHPATPLTVGRALCGAVAAGESNLKIRRPVDLKGAMPRSSAAAAALVGLLQCEPPNARLHSFEGRLSTHTLDRAAPRSPHRRYSSLCCERVELHRQA
jgi:hypothetical protein